MAFFFMGYKIYNTEEQTGFGIELILHFTAAKILIEIDNIIALDSFYKNLF